MEQINKLIDDCIQRYSRTPRVIPLEVVDDFKLLKKLLAEKENPVEIKEVVKQTFTKDVKPLWEDEMIYPVTKQEETIEQVRARYEHKMQKKPFMWWDKQTLYTKMWE